MNALPDIGHLTLVGGGNMGGALLNGWLAAGLRGERVVVVDPGPSSERRARWEAAGVEVVPVPGEQKSDVLVVAVKPQVIDEAIEATRDTVTAETVVLSVVAGVGLEKLRSAYGPEPRCVRVMPNTPSQVGRGVSVCCPSDDAKAEDRDLVTKLMSAAGAVEWVEDERLMDAVTGVSGSGPAYVFHLVEALAAAGEAAGLPERLAASLALCTVTGAGELLHRSEETPEALRRAVTSPNGTTQAGLDVLMPELGDLMRRTVAAAAKRSAELG